LIDKGAVERFDENFSCRAVITKEQIQRSEAKELISKLFDGSAEVFLSAFVSGKSLPGDEIARLKQLVENLREKTEEQ
jgi:predicted transcriptional regulator